MGELSSALFSWIITFGLGALIISSINNYFRIKSMGKTIEELKDDSQRLVLMHEHADDHGFGTRRTNEMITQTTTELRDATKAILELVNEMRFYRESQKGR